MCRYKWGFTDAVGASPQLSYHPRCPHPRNKRNHRNHPSDYLGGPARGRPTGRVHGVVASRDPGVVRGDELSWTAARDRPSVRPSLIRRAVDQFPFNSNQLPPPPMPPLLLLLYQRGWTPGRGYCGPARREYATRDACRRTLRLSLSLSVCLSVSSTRRICDRCDTKLHEN